MADGITDTIRTSGCASVRAMLADGSERALAVGAGRGRYARLSRTLESLDWTRLELLDSGGAVLDVITRESTATDDAAPPADDPVARQVAIISAETRRHAELLRNMMADALQAQRDTIAMLSELTQRLAATHAEAIEAIRAAADADARVEAATAAAKSDDTALISKVLETVPALLAANGNGKGAGT